MVNDIIFSHVSKSFRLGRYDTLQQRLVHYRDSGSLNPILKDISFTVKRGSVIGLYGANGAGKSTLLRIAAGIIEADTGKVHTARKVASVIELGSGFHPDLTGLENIYLISALLGTSKSHLLHSLSEIIKFSGLEDMIRLKIKKYSSGMKARLAISIAIFSDAKILLIDEAMAVGDSEFQRKIAFFLKNSLKDRTILLASHNISYLHAFCSTVLILENGILINSVNSQMIQLLKSLREGDCFTGEIQTGSMLPIISSGEKISVIKKSFHSIRNNDIIAFSFKNFPCIFIHRVEEIVDRGGEKFCYTKGDDNIAFDQWTVSKEEFLGKVVIAKLNNIQQPLHDINSKKIKNI